MPTVGSAVTVMVKGLPSASVALKPSGLSSDSSFTAILVLAATGATLVPVTVMLSVVVLDTPEAGSVTV